MIGYIIGLVLGVVIFLLQNLKLTTVGFRLMFLITSIAFIWGIFYAHLGYWNVLLIPIGEVFLCFISAVCFPLYSAYGPVDPLMEYETINGDNYFAQLNDKDKIGRIDAPGLKQTYDKIMGGIISQIVSNQKDLQYFGNLLYSKNFYPISIHTKEEVLQHINACIDKVANSSTNGDSIKIKANKKIEQLFNTYVSVMSIHEEATKNIEEITKHRV